MIIVLILLIRIITIIKSELEFLDYINSRNTSTTTHFINSSNQCNSSVALLNLAREYYMNSIVVNSRRFPEIFGDVCKSTHKLPVGICGEPFSPVCSCRFP